MSSTALDQVIIPINATGQLVLGAILALIMFGVALDLRLQDFAAVIRKPLAPLTGLAAQTLLLPAMTWAMTMLLKPQPSVALGMIVVGACPGGNLSNLITHLGRGNTALSVCITGLSSAMAVVATPLNILFWASLNPDTAALMRQVEIQPGPFLAQTALILGLPMLLGVLIAHRLPDLAARLRRPFQIFAFAFLIVFIAATTAANGRYLLAFLGLILPLVAAHNTFALLLGWLSARLMRLDIADTRAVTIEVGMQNSGLGLTLILSQFDALGGAALIAAGWGIWHIVSGWALATLWTRRDKRKARA